ncbi:hypothetical protein [Methylobacterium persicinum]|uniref:Uncharacterized protein n=1 Tax=Methylobacterium persicinum TaxID=374426 RepID=A0ABU0HL72_9HYPH|nr:hypothetical protein [Methylobacterium persicinum]MDQ0443073.1 hypothetical protein [Methylobacterium persicinum]GJE39010.1 hypothetical protein KHHGKMAE_3088 [Methylobacterium persicinum]
MIGYLLNPSPWLDIILVGGGLGLIWWDVRRPRGSPGLAGAAATAVPSLKQATAPAAIDQKASKPAEQDHVAYLEKKLEEARANLIHVNAVRRLFELPEDGQPLDFPVHMNLARLFLTGELMALAKAAMTSGNGAPLNTREIATFVIRHKGWTLKTLCFGTRSRTDWSTYWRKPHGVMPSPPPATTRASRYGPCWGVRFGFCLGLCGAWEGRGRRFIQAAWITGSHDKAAAGGPILKESARVPPAGY